MRPIPLPAILLTAALSAAAAPGKPPEPGGAGDIVLGEVGSLSGPRNTFGRAIQRGVQLAVDQANAAGGVKGRKLVVRVYDDESTVEEAGNATARLITQDHAAVILGEAASSNSLAMADKAQAAGVPMISPSSTNPAVTEKGDHVFRVCFTDPFQGRAMARFARQNLKLTRIAVLEDVKSRYSMGLADFFGDELNKLGGVVVAHESFSQGDTDFRRQLTAIKAAKPEALYLPAYYSDVGTIAHQARELGLKVPLLGGDGWDSPHLDLLSSGDIEGGYFSTHFSADAPSEQARGFIAGFQKAYGERPEAQAALGYDAAMLAIDALKRARDLTGPALREALAATRDFRGVTGTLTLDRQRNPIKPAVVLKVTKDGFKYVATITP